MVLCVGLLRGVLRHERVRLGQHHGDVDAADMGRARVEEQVRVHDAQRRLVRRGGAGGNQHRELCDRRHLSGPVAGVIVTCYHMHNTDDVSSKL